MWGVERWGQLGEGAGEVWTKVPGVLWESAAEGTQQARGLGIAGGTWQGAQEGGQTEPFHCRGCLPWSSKGGHLSATFYPVLPLPSHSASPPRHMVPPQSPPSSLVFYSFIASKSPSPGLSPHPVSLLTASPRILWFLNTHRHRHSLALHLLPASCLLPICVRPLPSHMQRAPHPYNHPCTPSPYQSPGTGKGCPDAVCLSRG